MEQTSAGFYDIYLVQQYDFDGALIEAGNMGSPYSDYGHVLTMAPNGDILEEEECSRHWTLIPAR